jgi:hypothetical protein
VAEGDRRVREAHVVEGGGVLQQRPRGDAGAMLSRAGKLPRTWQARMRSSRMAGMLEASESRKPSSTMRAITARSGRGSSRHMLDFSAKACVRSWITEAPSP